MCRSTWSIHLSQPWRASSNLCQCHESREGGMKSRLFSITKNRLNSCYSSRAKNRRAKRRCFIPDEGLQMQSHISWRVCLDCKRKKGRSQAGVLRLPPVSTASKSSRTPPAISLRLVWSVKYWTASQPAVPSPPTSPPFAPSSPNGGVLLAQGIYTHQAAEGECLPVWKKKLKLKSNQQKPHPALPVDPVPCGRWWYINTLVEEKRLASVKISK